MGCHTWLYANRKPLPNNLLDVAEEIMFEKTNEFNNVKHIFREIDKEILFFKTLEYIKDIENIDESHPISSCLTSSKERTNAFEAADSKAKANGYFSFIFNIVWGLGWIDCTEDLSYEEFLKESNRFINEWQETRIYYKLDTDVTYFLDGALKKILGNDGSRIILLDEGKYATQLEKFNPFRVTNYPEIILKSRVETENFLFKEGIENGVCMYIYENQENGNVKQIFKHENYKKFVDLVKNELDELYLKYPDLIIQFG